VRWHREKVAKKYNWVPGGFIEKSKQILVALNETSMIIQLIIHDTPWLRS
jgi:hypothetical protein